MLLQHRGLQLALMCGITFLVGFFIVFFIFTLVTRTTTTHAAPSSFRYLIDASSGAEVDLLLQ